MQTGFFNVFHYKALNHHQQNRGAHYPVLVSTAFLPHALITSNGLGMRLNFLLKGKKVHLNTGTADP